MAPRPLGRHHLYERLVLAAGADKAVRNDEVVATLKAICAHHAAPAAAAA